MPPQRLPLANPVLEPAMSFDVTLADLHTAATRISGKVRITPTYHSPALSTLLGAQVLIKAESLQLHGSFKLRGCLNKMLTLTPDELKRGVVTVSGGNHAIAVSATATMLGSDALVLMPKTASPHNIGLAQAAGGSIELCEDAADAFAKAASYAAQGRINIHSYDDPLIIAGHGTMGLELIEEATAISAAPLDHAFISIGGGGFVAGVGLALKSACPDLHLHGVETEGATTMTQALAANEPVTIRATSIAKTLGAPFATPRTMAAAKAFLDQIILVPDSAAVSALVTILEAEHLLVEPAASCVLAAALTMKDQFKPTDRVALILCGSNVTLADVTGWRQQFGV
jgi:threonine dehydratase